MKLDYIDKNLLNILQKDSKKTNKELSVLLNLSVTAVYERIKKLEKNGVISKYVAILDRKKIKMEFVVFCHIKLVQHTRDSVTQFEQEIASFKEVVECYHVSGDYDYIVKIFVSDMEAYREFMVKKLTAIKHIGSTQSTFMIGEVKHSTAVTL